MKKFLFYVSLFLILHAVQFLFTGVPIWSQIQADGNGFIRAAGLFFLHAGAIVYATAYGLGDIK